MRSIRRRQQIPHEEDDENQLDGGAHRVVLVAGLDVADEHGRAGHLLEGVGDVVHDALELVERALELHVVGGRGEERHEEGRGKGVVAL